MYDNLGVEPIWKSHAASLVSDGSGAGTRRVARLYGVSVKRLNQQVRRNSDRFPADFMFQLDVDGVTEIVRDG